MASYKISGTISGNLPQEVKDALNLLRGWGLQVTAIPSYEGPHAAIFDPFMSMQPCNKGIAIPDDLSFDETTRENLQPEDAGSKPFLSSETLEED